MVTSCVQPIMLSSAPLSPPFIDFGKTPGFGAQRLTPAQLETYCHILNASNKGKNTSYIAANVCYALDCSRRDFEDFLDSTRSMLLFITKEQCHELSAGTNVETLRVFKCHHETHSLRTSSDQYGSWNQSSSHTDFFAATISRKCHTHEPGERK